MIDGIKCPICGGQKNSLIKDNEYRCEYCGHTFRVGAQEPVASPHTPFSNTFQQERMEVRNPYETPQPVNEKNRIVAAILAIFLGGIGIHHFYLGNMGRGIIYLLLCWTYIPTIIGFVEGVLIICQTDEEFAIRPKILI